MMYPCATAFASFSKIAIAVVIVATLHRHRGAADQLFDTVRAELDDDPDNWVRWYRVARAYDYAGDRSRAREAMKRAVLLEERQ